MTDQIPNNTKDNYTNSINNYSSDNTKNQIPISNINTNINSNLNSFSQENLFNELISSTNCQESKNSSSFYNFSESIHSNQDSPNPNIIMNKDQLYQTFLLFQKFLNQNLYNNNLNNISPNENENIIRNKTSSKSRDKDKNNAIDKINEINEFDDNEGENKELYNGKNISKKNKANQKFKNQKKENNEIQKELLENLNINNIINGKNITNNKRGDNMIFLDKNENKDILYKKDNNSISSQSKDNDDYNNKNIKQRNNKDINSNINNNISKNSYDEIPIKFNKENFIDLVEKKLADEKKFEYKTQDNNNEQKKNEHIHKIKQKKENEKINQIQYNLSNNKKNKNKGKNDKNKNKNCEKKENIIDKDKNESNIDEEKSKNEKINITNIKNNDIINNYSYDKDDTHVLNENKNIFESSSIIDNLNNIINKSNLKRESAKLKKENINNNTNNNDNNNDNIIISRNNLNKLFLNDSKEMKIKNYKIEKIEICLLSDIINNKNKKNESENEDNKIDEKEELLNQKIKEINKEMVKLKEDRNKVNKLKIEYEKSMSKLNNELYQFTQKKEEFEKFRKNELNKIKNDKKNILAETKNIKDIKSQNQALVLKTKKDKETIDNLKSKISELQSIIKQKENNSIGINYSSNTFKHNQKRNIINRNNIIEELEVEDINSNPIIDGYYGNIQNSSIRSMTNINSIFNNTIEDKIGNKINALNKDKDLDNLSMTLKRNNSSNKNYIISKKLEVLKNKNINTNNLTSSNLGLFNDNKIIGSNSNNKSGECLSMSKKKSSEKAEKILGNKDIINDKNIFSPQPQACRTAIGFGLKKLSIKLNNTPKENVKVSKKIFENKNNQNNKKQSYSKTTTTNNLSGSVNNNINNDSNQNSYSNINNTNNNNINNNTNNNSNNNNNNKIIINNKKLTKDNKQLKNQSCNEMKNKVKKVMTSKKSKNDIFSSKNKSNSINQHLKINKKFDNDNLNNSTNNKMMLFNNKTITKENISRNLNSKKKEKSVTDNNTNNLISHSTLINKDINKNSDEYDFKIPQKYLNKEYKLLKTLKADDKIINLYSNEKKEIIFKSGVKKEIYQDGHQIIYFVNGDLKQIFPTGKSCYYFSETKTVQITLNNGIEIYKFENGQIEKHYPDGTKKILFNDGTERYIYSDGYEETYFSDGNVQKVDKKKNIIVEKLDANIEK